MIISEEKLPGLVEADEEMMLVMQMRFPVEEKCEVKGSKGFRLMIYEKYGLY